MPSLSRQKIALLVCGVAVLIGAGSFLVSFFYNRQQPVPAPAEVPQATTTVATPEPAYRVIGASVEGRKIESYTYGHGDTLVTFVGGMHGGYEWNSVLLAYQYMDYLEANPDSIPDNVSIAIIPSLNPDGVFKVVKKEGRFTRADAPKVTDASGLGRFNGHDVDLNRNFDCKWQPESSWRSKAVSAGTAPFSEPESQALRDFVTDRKPNAVIFWHSQSNAVYASECKDGILPDTLTLMRVYAKAAGYASVEKFDAYPITGDAEGWLASINIPAITVELSTHDSVDWSKNISGIKAVLEFYKTKV